MKVFFENLPAKQQISVAIQFAQYALVIWEKYAVRGKLTYRDSVVGLKHTTDKNLLARAMHAIENSLQTADKITLYVLLEEFTEPIVALQDFDWELPDDVLKTFYAVYNLLQAMAGKTESVFGESNLYVSVNQSIDALLVSQTLTIEKVREVLGITL